MVLLQFVGLPSASLALLPSRATFPQPCLFAAGAGLLESTWEPVGLPAEQPCGASRL